MNAKVLILVTAVFFAVSVLVSDREARAEDRAERAEERAEKAMERAEERAEKRAERAERAKEKAEERAEKKSRKKAEKRAKERAESTEGRAGGSDESEGRGSEDVTIKVQGGRQTEFSGTCAVGGEESAIGGQTPRASTTVWTARSSNVRSRTRAPARSGSCSSVEKTTARCTRSTAGAAPSSLPTRKTASRPRSHPVPVGRLARPHR